MEAMELRVEAWEDGGKLQFPMMSLAQDSAVAGPMNIQEDSMMVGTIPKLLAMIPLRPFDLEQEQGLEVAKMAKWQSHGIPG